MVRETGGAFYSVFLGRECKYELTIICNTPQHSEQGVVSFMSICKEGSKKERGFAVSNLRNRRRDLWLVVRKDVHEMVEWMSICKEGGKK